MNDIFNWLTDNKSKLMNKFILKMIPNTRDADDFYQDLYLIMADKNLSKMTKIYEANEMEQYMYIIIRNNLQSKTSRYYYTYRKPLGVQFVDTLNVPNRFDETSRSSELLTSQMSQSTETPPEKYVVLQELENDYKDLMQGINKYMDKQLTVNPKSFYDKKVFEMYYNDENTYRGLGDILGIPHCSIYKTVTKNRVKIVKLFKTEIENINKKLIYYYTL